MYIYMYIYTYTHIHCYIHLHAAEHVFESSLKVTCAYHFISCNIISGPQFIAGWWYTYPSEKYEFVKWDDDILKINGKISLSCSSHHHIYHISSYIIYHHISYIIIVYHPESLSIRISSCQHFTKALHGFRHDDL